jgi:hypothetical protein
MYAVDEDIAEAALLTLQDFPVGWTATPIPDAQGGSVAWEECVGNTGNGDLLDLGGVRASSDSFNSEEEISKSVESTVTIAEQEAVDDFIAGLGDADCIRGIVESGLGDAFDELSVGELNLSPTGNDLVAYRIVGTTSATEQGIDISVETFVDLVVVQIGNALTTLEFYSARQAITGAEPFSATEIDGFVAVAADRLAGLVSVAVEPNSAGPQPCEGAKVTVNYDADLVKNGLGCRPTPTQQIDVLISASEPNPAQVCTKMDGWLRPAVAGDPLGGWVCEYADPELLR